MPTYRGPTGISLAGGSATIERNVFQNLPVAVRMAKGVKADIRDNIYENVGTRLEITDD